MTDTPTLITKTVCSNCKAVKKQLDKWGLEVEVRNVDDDPDAKELAASLGILSAPALLADGHVYRSMSQILDWIKQNRDK